MDTAILLRVYRTNRRSSPFTFSNVTVLTSLQVSRQSRKHRSLESLFPGETVFYIGSYENGITEVEAKKRLGSIHIALNRSSRIFGPWSLLSLGS